MNAAADIEPAVSACVLCYIHDDQELFFVTYVQVPTELGSAH